MNKLRLISLGTMYVDINCINFPFTKALSVQRETTGNEYQLELGGSALNFARLTAQLGLHTTFIGKIGKDMMGKILLELLKKNTIYSSVIEDGNVQTNLAAHYIYRDGTSVMTSSGSANQALTYHEVQERLAHHEGAALLYIGGCFKLKKLLPYLPALAKMAQKKGIRVILDHGRITNQVSKEDIQIIRELITHTDIYLPSIDEFLMVWESQTIAGGIISMKDYGQPCTVIKQGDFGAVGFYKNNRIEISAVPISVINTVGAGDSFNAGFIKAYSEGKDMKECIRYACATAVVKAPTLELPTNASRGKLLERR